MVAVNKSIEWAPDNSAYLRHAAEVRELQGLPAAGLRERAVGANPLDSSNWISLAARSELDGRSREAEKELLQAYAVDRQFEPRWALASFYFRTGRVQESLAWARRALEFGAGDQTAVFQLCWAVSGNSSNILKKGIPYRADKVAQYMQFLDSTGRIDAADDAAKMLLRRLSRCRGWWRTVRDLWMPAELPWRWRSGTG